MAPRSELPPRVDRAAALASEGNPRGAARAYEALAAESSGASRTDMLLAAAREYLAAHEANEAARVLAAIRPPLAAAQSFEQQMLLAELDLARGEGQRAWARVTQLRQPSAAPAALRYLGLERRAALAAAHPADAVRAEVESERFLETPGEQRAARMTLLAELRAASEQGMKIDPSAVRDPTVRGWLALAVLTAESARAPASAAAALQAWRDRYPGHPADAVIASELRPIEAAPRRAAPTIALLLPLTGRAGSAAATVRDGFLTAYFVGSADERPRIRIYDTGAASIADAVGRATEDGADFIVGPLTRGEVVAAADLRSPHPPILALNFLPPEHAAPDRFYEFALSPEEEARDIARRILADGHRHGIALLPLGDWGTRVLTAFQTELTAGGGALIAAARFDPSLTDFAPAIRDVLGIEESNARLKRLEAILGARLESQPRRRGDIDFIFEASGSGTTARLLRTQLRFYFAGSVPAYATSDSFEPDPTANQDLDGLDFPDMPWVLGSGLADSVRAAVNAAWPAERPPQNRLFAFGFDAYRLFAALRAAPSGSAISVEGLTGTLTLDSSGRVHRQLEWAQLRDGQPRLISQAAAPGTAPASLPPAAPPTAPARVPN